MFVMFLKLIDFSNISNLSRIYPRVCGVNWYICCHAPHCISIRKSYAWRLAHSRVHTLLIEHCSDRYIYTAYWKTITAVCNATRRRDNSYEGKGETRSLYTLRYRNSLTSRHGGESLPRKFYTSQQSPTKKAIMIRGSVRSSRFIV